MPNAVEYFTELSDKIAPANFSAKLLTSTGKAQSFKIYNKIFEEGKSGDYAVFTSLADDRSIEYLKILLMHSNSNILYNVLFFLRFQKMHTMKPLLYILLELLKYTIRNNGWVSVVKAICNIGGQKEVIGALVEFLKDENWEVRERAIKLLLDIGIPESIEPVLEFFNLNNYDDSWDWLREEALFLMKDPRTINARLEALKGSHSHSERIDAALIFRKISVSDPEILQPVVELLKEA
jgi:hypothetical protein